MKFLIQEGCVGRRGQAPRGLWEKWGSFEDCRMLLDSWRMTVILQPFENRLQNTDLVFFQPVVHLEHVGQHLGASP